MRYFLMLASIAGITALDQWTKALTLARIPLYGHVPVIDGLFHLTYVQNTGAAFSSFEGMQWLFALIFAAFTVWLFWEFSGKRLPFKSVDRALIVAIYAGGLGNMIDRLRLGFGVDMIEVDFINFPVFNVADCFITCGCIVLLLHLLLFNKEFWKEETK